MLQSIIDAVRSEATKRKIPLANALACVSVESGGEMTATVNGKSEPIIRWEGHYFDRLVKPTLRDKARRDGLASPKVGGISNPASQEDRYNKLLFKAAKLDREAAFASASYGAPQVMGANARSLGYNSAEELYLVMKNGAAGQIEVMFKFIDKNGLVDELQRGDFAGFARVYNGPKFRANGYDTKMATEAKRFAKQFPDGSYIISTGGKTLKPTATLQSSTMLRVGTSGARVREAQSLLNRAAVKYGLTVIEVDGDFGPTTQTAVLSFQRAVGFVGADVDGMIGPKTWTALDPFRAAGGEQPGQLGALDTDEAKTGGVTAGGGVALAAVIDQAKGALYPLTGSGGLTDTIYTTLTLVGVALVIGGVAWAAYGYLKSRKTHGISIKSVA